MQPYNYTLGQQQSSGEAFAEGMKPFMALRQLQANQQLVEAKAKAEQQAVAADEARNAEIQRFIGLGPNRTIEDVMRLSVFMPKDQFAGVTQTWETKSKEAQQDMLGLGSQVLSSIQSGNPEMGVQLLNDRADAAAASGDKKLETVYRSYASNLGKNPDAAFGSLSLMLAGIPGGKDAIESALKVRIAPSQEAKATAEAKTAGVTAKYAERKTLADLEKSGWDVKKIQSDIDLGKQNARIAAMNAAANREGNALKRQELQLKITEAQQKASEATLGKAAELESARFNMDNMLNTADRILNTPSGVIESATGPISTRMPTLSADTADFEELVNTLGSQSFLSQIPNIKGMGALSNAEGEKLQSALQNLNLRQSDKQLVSNVKEAQRLILKARSNIAKRYGMPDTTPDTPAAQPSAGDINDLLKKYGGK